MMRRNPAGMEGQVLQSPISVRANLDEVRKNLRYLGPSNPATNPKNTRSTTVKIKTGLPLPVAPPRTGSAQTEVIERISEDGEGDETTRLLQPRPTGSNTGAPAMRQSYGSADIVNVPTRLSGGVQPSTTTEAPLVGNEVEDPAPQAATRPSSSDLSLDALKYDRGAMFSDGHGSDLSPPSLIRKTIVRSGSITENIIEAGKYQKVVLETTSSTEEDELGGSKSPSPTFHRGRSSANVAGAEMSDVGEEEEADGAATEGQPVSERQHHHNKKKNRRKKRKGSKS